jgi:hypothetical protein
MLLVTTCLSVGCGVPQHRDVGPATPSTTKKPEVVNVTVEDINKAMEEAKKREERANVGRFQLLYAPANSGSLVLRMDTTTGETWWLEERKSFSLEEIQKNENAHFRWTAVKNDKKYPWESAEGDHVWTPEEVKKLREQQSPGDPLGLFTPEENAKRKANKK